MKRPVTSLCVWAIIFSMLSWGAPCSGEQRRPELVSRIDRALVRAARFLVQRQSADGAWRSRSYGCFKDGPELTPLILSSLFFMPQAGPSIHRAYLKGTNYLTALVRQDGSIAEGESGLLFPVLTSAMASRVVVLYERNEKTLQAQSAWLAYLRARQLNQALGWSEADPQFGGWGFALKLPRKPASGEFREPFCESNLVATIFGIAALRSAKLPAEDHGYRDALVFVQRCQNYAAQPEEADQTFDDGGFFFIPGDPVQNKAGIAGKDRSGRDRYHSYGSMTADGLRALLRCGLAADNPRVVAARTWLERNFSAQRNPGRFAPDREVLRNATYYYYCWAVAHAFAALKVTEVAAQTGKVRWAESLSQELLRRQKPDGSWVNTLTDAKEDDPLVATPWAAVALAICRESITGEIRELVPRRTR